MEHRTITVEQLLQGLPVTGIAGDPGRPVVDVTQDSRQISEGMIFVALRGEHFDGNLFALQAAASGAAAVVSEDPPPATLPGDTVWVTVPDPRRALAALARSCHREPDTSLQLVGITGTNGKTTTVYLVQRMLEEAGFRCGLISGVDVHAGDRKERASLTTPEADHFFRLLANMRDDGCTHCVMEVSSHALERHRVAGARFRSTAFSNLSRDHLDYHLDMERYFQAKKKLFTANRGTTGSAVVNIDDPFGARLAEELEGTVFRCGTESEADLRAVDLGVDWTGTRVEVGGNLLDRPLTLHTPLIGRTNGANLLLAAAVCLEMGVPPRAVAGAAETFAGVPGRFQVISAPAAAGFRVVVDYAHTDDALRHLLRSMRELTGEGRLITLFGCGGDRDPGKRPLMGRTAASLSDHVVLTSDNPRTEDPLAIIAQVEEGVRRGAGPETGVAVESDRRRAIATALGLARPGDTVVVAGKGHEDYQILGRETIHFDDREVIQQMIEEKCNEQQA